MGFIADVFDVLLIDDNGDVIATTTLQDANIDVSVASNDIKGGKGNPLLGTLHSDRDINIDLSDAEFKYEWLAKQFGQDIVTGAGVAYAMPKWYTTVDGGTSNPTITLDKTPIITDSGLKIYNFDGQEVTGFTVTGSEVDFTAATPAVAIGDKVEVRTYKYDTDASTETIEIDNSVFAKGVTAVLETLEIDGEEKPLAIIQYQFDKAVPTGSFSINTASERSAQAQSFALRVIKPKTTTKVGRVLRIPVSA